jgi:HK97 family phage major capsid protein
MRHEIAPAVLGIINGKPVYEVRGGVDPDPAVKDKPVTMGIVSDQLQKAFEEHQKKLEEKFQKYETELKETGSISEATKADLRKMSEDYLGMRKDLDKVLEAQTKWYDSPQKKGALSPGQELIESDEYKAYKEAGGGRMVKRYDDAVFVKNTVSNLTGSPEEVGRIIAPFDRMPGVVGGAFRMLRLLDVVPMGATSLPAFEYTRELTFTNNAAEVQEKVAKPETDVTFELATANVRTIAHFLKVSKQMMDDAPAVMAYIDQRLRYGVRLKLETQIVAGNGTSPNLSGFIGDTDNHTALSAVSGEIDFDAANRAKYKVIESEYTPDVIMVNPADWSRLERKKINSSDNRYVGAEGVISYLSNGLIATLWGLPVIMSNSITAGKFAALSLDALMLWMRQEAVVTIHDQDEDNAQKNLLTVRGELRGAFTVFRPSAVVVGSWPEA